MRARPAGESLDVTIGAALVAMAIEVDDPDRRISDVRRLLDRTPGPRARLWDHTRTARESLEVAIAERLHADVTDLSVRFTAGIMLETFQLIDEIRKHSNHERSHSEVLDEVLRKLPTTRVVSPAHPALGRTAD